MNSDVSKRMKLTDLIVVLDKIKNNIKEDKAKFR